MKANRITLDNLRCKCEYSTSSRGFKRLIRACIKHRKKREGISIKHINRTFFNENCLSLVKDGVGNYV